MYGLIGDDVHALVAMMAMGQSTMLRALIARVIEDVCEALLADYIPHRRSVDRGFNDKRSSK